MHWPKGPQGFGFEKHRLITASRWERPREGMPDQPKKETNMLKSILTPALIALTLAGSGAAFAASPSADAQLAASAGVAAGQYTPAELQAIIDARRDNDTSALNYYLSGSNRTAPAQTDAAGQLANLAGVAPGTYSASELALIIEARKDNDAEQAAFILSGKNRAASAEASAVTPGEAQIAASLGLDPAQYTLAELTRLWAAAND